LPEPLLRSPELLVVNADYSRVLFRFHSEPLGMVLYMKRPRRISNKRMP
jgi:hypothetical protein